MEEQIDIQNYEICFDGRMDTLQNILSDDVNKRDSEGNTPLLLVLRDIKTNVGVFVKHLLKIGAEVNAVNLAGLSPLHVAILYKNCSVDILELLVDKGADILLRSNLGQTPIDIAMKTNTLDANFIKLLFEKAENHPAFAEQVDVNLLSNAIIKNLPPSSIQILLDKGVDYNSANVHGEFPLLCAVTHKRIEILKLLLKQPEIQVNMLDYMDFSPLHHAVSATKLSIDVIKVLLDSGADVEKKTRNRMRAMHFAMYLGNIEVIKLLLNHGAQVNVLESGGRTPLYLAVKFCHNEDVEVIKLLLEAGAFVFLCHPLTKIFPQGGNCTYDKSTSALFVASQKHHRSKSEDSLQRVQLLLKYALIERPEINYKNLSDDEQTCDMLSQYGSKCLRELNSTCINNAHRRENLSFFIFRLRIQKDEDYYADDILDMLVTDAYPMYRDVLSSLLKRKELEEKFKERNIFAFKKELGQPCTPKRVVLPYDVLCCLMKNLSKEDLLNLMLAFYEAPDDSHVNFPFLSDASQDSIAAGPQSVFKRAKIN